MLKKFEKSRLGLAIKAFKQGSDIHKKNVRDSDWFTRDNFWYYTLSANSLERGSSTISIQEANIYYNNISPIFTAVDKISTEFQQLQPQIYDPKTNTFETANAQEEKLLQFLNNPNPDITFMEMLYSLITYYLVSGNAYILLTGNINREPLGMEILDPKDVTPIESQTDNFIKEYRVTTNNQGSIVFKREETKDRFRYVNNDIRELWHIKTFNINKEMLGTSYINYVLYEVRQHLEGSKHNLSTLLKGARLSGILFAESSLAENQREDIVKEVKSMFQGSTNAGEIGFFDGGKVDFRALSTSMKDMDFKELKQIVTNAIYNTLKVPLALLIAESMTLDNLKTAIELLYDNAVIPLGRRMFQELTMLLNPRFKIEKKLLTFNIATIPALETRRNRNLELRAKTFAFTINELRNIVNMPPIANGDEIYIPLNLVPLGASNDTNTDLKSLSKETLKQYIDCYGRQLFTDEEIEEINKR